VVHFLLFSPVLLVSTLRFMTAYVTPSLDDAHKSVQMEYRECSVRESATLLRWSGIVVTFISPHFNVNQCSEANYRGRRTDLSIFSTFGHLDRSITK
jgi:hypothetical protein